MLLVRDLNAEFVFLRKPLPLGGRGVVLSPDGTVAPGDMELRQLVADYGSAGKIGDRVQITNVTFKDNNIIFEINGGPVKKKKWYQHIEIGGMGGMAPVAPGPDNTKAYGSFIVLRFPGHIPDLTSGQVKRMLAPVLDFSSLSPAESFTKSMPPLVADAIKEHNVLVGMDRQMVEYARGRPDRKIREKDEQGVAYEEWLYGFPPQEVQFIRFVGDYVTRVEIMTVDGKKIVRTEKEVDLSGEKPKPVEAKTETPPPAQAPTLRRPGETPAQQTAPTTIRTGGTVAPPVAPRPDPAGQPTPSPFPDPSVPQQGPPH